MIIRIWECNIPTDDDSMAKATLAERKRIERPVAPVARSILKATVTKTVKGAVTGQHRVALDTLRKTFKYFEGVAMA